MSRNHLVVYLPENLVQRIEYLVGTLRPGAGEYAWRLVAEEVVKMVVEYYPGYRILRGPEKIISGNEIYVDEVWRIVVEEKGEDEMYRERVDFLLKS